MAGEGDGDCNLGDFSNHDLRERRWRQYYEKVRRRTEGKEGKMDEHRCCAQGGKRI